MNKRLVLLLPLVLAASLLVPSHLVPSARAAAFNGTGLVCITASTTATSCPTSPPVLSGVVGQTVSIGVFILNSTAMGGFDIYIASDPTILNPTSAALGTLITGPTSTIICINDVSVSGACSPAPPTGANAPGVVEVSTINGAGANECGGISPCSGLAFTITYSVVAASASTPLTNPSAAFCNPSSIQASPSTCVTVADNVGTILPELSQTASAQAVGLTLVSVVRGNDGNLYYNTFIGGWGTTWQPLNGQSPSPPSLCPSGPTTTELLVRGTDNGIYHKTFSGSTFAATWDKNPNGLTANQPVCAVIGTTLYVVVVATTGEIWFTTFDLSARTWAASWTDLLGVTPSVPAFVATPALSRLDLVVRGSNNQIYHKAFTSGAWAPTWDTSGRSPVPDKTLATPAIVSDGSQLHVVVIGSTGTLYYATLSFTGVWSTYISLVGATSVTPTLVIDSTGALHLVVHGNDNAVYEKAKPSGGSWDATWSLAGGITTGTPAATTVGSVLHVVAMGTDTRLWYNTLAGTTWSGWVYMNGASSRAPGVSTP